MATPAFEGDSEFLLGWCDRCGKEVLPYIDVDERIREVRRCLHCDAALDATLRAATAAELEDAGYAIVNARTCGNGGGCSSACGMRTAARDHH